MLEYWNIGLKEKKNGECVFHGFVLESFNPSFHHSIVPLFPPFGGQAARIEDALSSEKQLLTLCVER